MVLSLRTGPAGVFLAGGRGSRLGGLVKPALRFPSGERLLDRALERLEPALARRIVVAPALLWPHFAGAPGERVDDPGEGPVAALSAALPRVGEAWLLLSAADYPEPSRALLERLWGERGDADWVVPRWRGFLQPLFALYRREAVAAALRGGAPGSLRALGVALGETREVPVPADDPALEDVDQPEALVRLGLTLRVLE